MTVLMAMLAQAAVSPTLLVLPLDLIDTSGETPSHAEEHEQRAEALGAYLSKELAGEHIYTVIDPTPIYPAIATARSEQHLSECNGCERDLGKLAHVDRVLVGRIDKISTLIGNPGAADLERGHWADSICPNGQLPRRHRRGMAARSAVPHS